jgi:membrane-associated phospholipid phosphatase
MLFQFIHLNLANQVFDFLMPFFRNPYFWSPVYVFILAYMWLQYRWQGIVWCIFFILCFGFADFFSASILKPFVHRLRPCNTQDLQNIIRPLVHCGSGFSFPSSHASNHFALSSFIVFTLGKHKKWIIFFSFLWAGLVCFAQVYVGVHFPIDVLAGACLGILIGWANAVYFKMRFGLKNK